MSSWAAVMISIAILLLFAFPAVGLYLYSPRRARLIKHIELVDENLVIAHINSIRVRHPEITKIDRLDRHPAHLWINLILFAFGWVTMFVAVPYAGRGSEALGTRETLAASLLIGSTASLLGALLGARYKSVCFGLWVRDNETSPMLGDDIRLPYVLAWCGLLSNAISMGLYGYTVIASAGTPRLATTLGGIAAAGFMGSCLTLIPMFIARIRRYIEARSIVLTEALNIMAEEDNQP